MKLFRAWFLLVCASVAPAAVSAQENPLSQEDIQKLQQLFGTARQKEEAGDRPGAHKSYEEILKILPAGNANRPFIVERAHNNFAASGDHAAAIAFLNGELEKAADANKTAVYGFIAEHHTTAGEFKKSNEVLQKAIDALPKLQPGGFSSDLAGVLFRRSVNFAHLKDSKAALATLDNAVAAGYWNGDQIRREPAFASLKSDKTFEAIVKKSLRGISRLAYGLPDLAGKELKEKDFAGKVIILDIWGTWCPPCKMEIPHFVQLQNEYKDKGFAVIGLTWERQPPNDFLTKRVEQFAKDNKINYPLTMITAERLGAVPNLRGFPTTFFIGRDGAVRHRVSGYHNYEQLKSKVEPLIREKAPAPKREPAGAPESAPTASD